MSPSPVPDGYVRGPIFFDGGADYNVFDDYARNAFWNLAGGYGARIIVLTANKVASNADYGYAAAFEALEAASVRLLRVGSRAAGSDPALLEAIQGSTGVFLSGGHPLHWSTRIGGTRLATAIRRANARGKAVGAVGGSAAFLGNHMLVYGAEMPRMAPGLGLSNRLLVAAHFEPDVHTELLHRAIATNPYLLGLGLTKEAAIIRRADQTLEVAGLAEVTVIDGSSMTSTNLADWQPGQPLEAEGLRTLHLPREHRFDLERREALPPEVDLPAPRRSSL